MNGSLRGLWPVKQYVVVDIIPGPGVDIVADVRAWQPTQQFDVVVCTSLLEHVREPEKVISTAAKCLKSKGTLLLTTHTVHMHAHGARGSDDDVYSGKEYYHNFNYGELDVFFQPSTISPWEDYTSYYHGIDVFVHAVRK